VATKYTLKVEVLDNLGNLSTYTKVVSPWYEAVFNGPTDIPDYSPGGIFWYAKVEQPGLNTTVAEWRMRLNITHPYVGDLVAEYGPPNISLDQGELLFNQVGGSGQNFTNTTIADKVATQSIKSSGAAAPFTGNFKGESRVLSANTILVNGWHTLKIKDIASSDWGQMNNVRILFRFN
jgi:subtilisin-like proprotein convertase family protein